MTRHYCTYLMMNRCNSWQDFKSNYGNIRQNFKCFLFEFKKGITMDIVRNFRDSGVMMQSTHKSHNEKVWDYEASQNHAQNIIKDLTDIILNYKVSLKNIVVAHKLVGKVHMKITEI